MKELHKLSEKDRSKHFDPSGWTRVTLMASSPRTLSMLRVVPITEMICSDEP